MSVNLLFNIIILFSLIACSHKTPVRGPAELPLKYNLTCQRILASFFENPYKKNYDLKEYTKKEARRAFLSNYLSRKAKLKVKSRPFMMIHNDDIPRRAVLLLHGFSDSAGSMREVGREYYERGFNVVSILYRDHGLKKEFQYAKTSKSSVDFWREDVDFGASVAKAYSFDGKIDIAAFSMGSSLALDLGYRVKNLIRTRLLFGPLLRENGLVYQFLLWFVSIFKKNIAKEGDENPIFYKNMSLRMIQQMHKLTRQIRMNVLTVKDGIPTALVETDLEKTVDSKYIDHFAKVNDISKENRLMIVNRDYDREVFHRDLPAEKLSADGGQNPASPKIAEFIDGFVKRTSP